MIELLSAADIRGYLNRINYQGSLEPNAENLRQLQLAHLFTVPFENLSIHYSEPIVLDTFKLYDKIIRRNRGGFCFELNGLFSSLLASLGFNVSRLAAEVMSQEGQYSPPFDHMLLLVELEEPWVVDVGFGSSFLDPLRLDDGVEQQQINGTYRVDRRGDEWIYATLSAHGLPQPRCRFTLQPYDFADFQTRCDFHQTAPHSHFRKSRITTIAKPDRRLTLSDLRFITTMWSGTKEEVDLEDERSYQHYLEAYFGIKLGTDVT